MNCTFENNGSGTFMVYELSANEKLDTFSYGMMSNNNIKGLVPLIFTQLNNTKLLKYNISSKITLKQYFDNVVNKNDLLSIFLSIAESVIDAEDYMLEPSCFYYDAEYIYINLSNKTADLICFPVIPKLSSMSLCDFLKKVMINTQFNPAENTDYVAKIISFLNKSNTFSVNDFKALINELLSGDTTVQAKVQTDNVNAEVNNNSSQNIPINNNINNNNAPVAPPQQANNASMNGQAENNMHYGNTMNKPVQPGNSNNINNANNFQQPVAQKNKKEKKSHFSLFGGNKKDKSKKGKDTSKAKQKNTNNKVMSPFDNNMPNNNAGANNMQGNNFNSSMPGNANNANQGVNQNYTPMPAFTAANNSGKNNVPMNSAPAQNVNFNNSQYMNPAPASNFGDTIVLDNSTSAETTVLNAEPNNLGNNSAAQTQTQAYLIRTKNSEKIIINKSVFRIGKERSFVDYCISDNTYISGAHATILKKGEHYYILDNNSRNFSYVNGKQIVGSTEQILSSGDRLLLANEEFVFYAI